MNKLPVVLAGLVLVIAGCAPATGTIQPTEIRAPADSPATPTQVRGLTPAAGAQQPASTPTSQQTSSDETLIPSTPGARNFQPQLEQISIDLDEVVTLLPPDAIPAVLPERARDIMVSAAEAQASGIDPNVQVLGVEINGETRAYPIPYLSAHEIVNDTVGGRHIAVTW
jgi:hypothetical protein